MFSISPDNIPLMQRLTLTVEVEGLAFNEAWVEIRGIDMDMGQNRTRLRNVDRATWVGETILPICSRRHMRWEAVIRFGEELNIEIPFRFATQRR